MQHDEVYFWPQSWIVTQLLERLRNPTCMCTSTCNSIFASFIPSKIAANEKGSREKFGCVSCERKMNI